MAFITRSLFVVIDLTSVLLSTSYSAETPKQKKGSSENPSRPERKPVHLVVKSRAEIKQVFSYCPYPAVPSELEGYGGSQVGGAGTYRLSVDARGVVTQVNILKGFTVTAVYDERFSDVKGNAVPALDKVMVQALMRWRAKPGPTRVVDIYWSFGTRPWLNYGKPNVSEVIFPNFKKTGLSLGWALSLDSKGPPIWIADAHRGDGKGFVVRAGRKVDGVSGTGRGDSAWAANCLD